MTHAIELVPGIEGADGIRLDGTLYPAAEVAQALRERPRLLALISATQAAVAITDVARSVRGRLAQVDHSLARRVLGQIEDAEVQAWALLAELAEGEPAGPRVPRR